MKKIIHLSDLHIGFEDCGTRFQKIVENITFLKQPASDYVIVITGDLVENATHDAQTDEAIDYINQLKSRGYTVLVIPGNHNYGTGSWASAKYVSIFKERFYGDVNLQYPKVDIIDNVLFIGLDSTADELHWYDRMLAQGEIGKDQLKRLSNVINDPKHAKLKKVVYLHHHPFNFKLGLQLKDDQDLKKIIENKINVLLFGHLHDDIDSAGKIFNGQWGIPRAYNGGTATFKKGNCGVHRVIDMSKDPRSDYDGKFL